MNVSRKLTWLLRHGALQEGLHISNKGYVNTAEVLDYFNITINELREIVISDQKQRFEFTGHNSYFIRACQGHSDISGVDISELENSWRIFSSNNPLFHTTNQKNIDKIMEEGLEPMNRTHVHMASSRDSKVGIRRNNSVLLKIDTIILRANSPYRIYVSSNDVYLTRFVPHDCITICS